MAHILQILQSALEIVLALLALGTAAFLTHLLDPDPIWPRIQETTVSEDA